MKKTFLKMLLCASIFSISNASASTVKDLYFDSCPTVKAAINSDSTAYIPVGGKGAELLRAQNEVTPKFFIDLQEAANAEGAHLGLKEAAQEIDPGQKTAKTINALVNALNTAMTKEYAPQNSDFAHLLLANPGMLLEGKNAIHTWLKTPEVERDPYLAALKKAKKKRKHLAEHFANVINKGKIGEKSVADVLKETLVPLFDKRDTLQVPSRGNTP